MILIKLGFGLLVGWAIVQLLDKRVKMDRRSSQMILKRHGWSQILAI